MLVVFTAFVAVFAVSAQGQSPPLALVDVGVGIGSGNPIVRIPTSTNPNGQLKGTIVSVSGGDPTSVKPQTLNPNSVSDPGTITTTTGSTFTVEGTTTGTTGTVDVTGGTFTPVTSQVVGTFPTGFEEKS
jgi:hypothetical protein